MKTINLNMTIFVMTEIYPELIEILKKLGFTSANNSIIRNTLGRIKTLAGDIEKMKMDKNEIIKILQKEGFTIEE